MKTFAELFKKYRLRAEFDTFSAFGDALSQKGYFYEESIFSHWQKGTRVPTGRSIVIAMIEIFIERNAISTKEEADEFIATTGLGYLTQSEVKKINIEHTKQPPFLVPYEIANFTGREEIISKIQKNIKFGKIFLFHGPSGVGKTALAIKLGHLLRNKFPDGVLWYKVDSSNLMDILLSIARLYGEDVRNIKDMQVRSSIVRTLLANKKLLLIFDNLNSNHELNLLLPNVPTCSVIFTSQEHSLDIASEYFSIPINVFTKEEILEFFIKIFDKNYVEKSMREIMNISKKLGRLPLAVHIAASYCKKFRLRPEAYVSQLDEKIFDLQSLKYEDKNFFRAITIGFSKLDLQTKCIFASLGVFEGKDFSLDALAFINKISLPTARHMIEQLQGISFVEKSGFNRYRMHPLIKLFARKQISDKSVYLRAAVYYEQLLIVAKESNSYKTLRQEVDNIVYVFKKCYELEYWDQIITLWNPVEKLLSYSNEIKKLRSLMDTIDTTSSINKLQKLLTGFTVILLIFWILLFFSGLKTSFWNDFYSFLFGLMPLIGGFVGILRSKLWGAFRSNIGKAVLFLSMGLFCWGVGSLIWSYYNFFQDIEMPYPSLADIGYFPAYILWIAGILYLSRATGAKFNLNKEKNRVLLLIVPVMIAFFSYYFLFYIVKRSIDIETPIRVFFDLYYPTINIIILTLATIIFGLSVNFFGGKYRRSLFAILGGFVVMYVSDFAFSYAASTGNYYNGGYTDIIFTFAFFSLTWGTLSFYLTPKNKSI